MENYVTGYLQIILLFEIPNKYFLELMFLFSKFFKHFQLDVFSTSAHNCFKISYFRKKKFLFG